MKTEKEIMEAIENLKTKPEKTGWGFENEKSVPDFITALEWVLENKEL